MKHILVLVVAITITLTLSEAACAWLDGYDWR